MYQVKDDVQNGRVLSDDESDDEPTSLDLSAGNKDCCVLEVDDPEDEEVLKLLMEERPPDGFHVVNTETVPGLEDLEIVKNLQMFTQIYRVNLTRLIMLLQTVYFKLRRMVPCALCDLQFRVDLPEPDEVQLCVFGMALGLGKKPKKLKPALASKKNDEDLMFKLDEDQIPENSAIPTNKNTTQRKTWSGHNSTFLCTWCFNREEGRLSGFIHSFVTEVLAIVRSHVTALGGECHGGLFSNGNCPSPQPPQKPKTVL
ncbi:hypothetical protein NQ317_009779, partial [Molorchus minor]